MKLLVRAVLVVPGRVGPELALHGAEPEWNQDASGALGLQRADDSLDDRDAPLLADGTEPREDAVPPAPFTEDRAVELLALVGDDVPRASSGQRRPRTRYLPEDGARQRTSSEVSLIRKPSGRRTGCAQVADGATS